MAERPLSILVTGGSRGLGQALVEDLLTAGHSVATMSRSASPFTEGLSQRAQGAGSAWWAAVDLADAAAVERFVAEVERRFGRIDVLINNAAIAEDGVLALASLDAIQRVLRTNLEAPVYLSRLCVRAMLRNRGGHIINISSIVGTRGFSGLSTYSAAKGGLDALTRALARELGGRGIRVNSVAPGFLETELSRGLSPTQRAQIVRRTPLGRLGSVQDVVGVVRFLLSPAASFMTGQTLLVDGGLTC